MTYIELNPPHAVRNMTLLKSFDIPHNNYVYETAFYLSEELNEDGEHTLHLMQRDIGNKRNDVLLGSLSIANLTLERRDFEREEGDINHIRDELTVDLSRIFESGFSIIFEYQCFIREVVFWIYFVEVHNNIYIVQSRGRSDDFDIIRFGDSKRLKNLIARLEELDHIRYTNSFYNHNLERLRDVEEMGVLPDDDDEPCDDYSTYSYVSTSTSSTSSNGCFRRATRGD